jgi:hypothetical protein
MNRLHVIHKMNLILYIDLQVFYFSEYQRKKLFHHLSPKMLGNKHCMFSDKLT